MANNPPDFPADSQEDFIFVCYSHADQEIVDAEIEWLRQQGHAVWYDAHIQGGAEWNDELALRIQGCKRLLFFVSPNSVNSSHCRNELNYAQQHGRRMLAVEIAPTDVPAGLQLMLNARQILFRHRLSQKQFRQRLLDALSSEADSPAREISRLGKPAPTRSVRGKRLLAGLGAALLIAALVAYFSPFQGGSDIDFKERDWVVVGNLINRTRDPQLGEALETTLRIALEQSKFASILAASVIRDAKARMELDPDAPMDRETAIELAQREDAKVSVVGEISQLGDSYTISIEMLNASNGATVWSGSSHAENLDGVLPAVDEISRQVREHLGESLSSIQASSLPLAKVTTPNLEALRAYSLAEKSVATGDWEAGVDLLKRALAVDPEFAMAHGKMAAVYIAWARQPELAIEHYELALQNRSRLSPREQVYIEASSAWLKTPAEMRRGWKSMSAMFPNEAVGFNNLGEVFRRYYLDFEAAEPEYRASAERRSPWRSFAVYNVAQCQLALERPEEALETFKASYEIDGHPVDYGLAVTYIVLRRHEEAQEFISSTNPAEVPNLRIAAQFTQIWLLADQGDIGNALQRNSRMLSNASEADERARTYANQIALLEGGDSPEAFQTALQEALTLGLEAVERGSEFADRPLLTRLAILSRVAVRSGLRPLAEPAIAAVHDRLPGNGFPVDQAWYELLEAELMLQNGDAATALEHAQRSVENAELFQAHETLTRIHARLGDTAAQSAALNWMKDHRGRAFIEDFDWFYGQLFNILDWSRAAQAVGDS